MHEEDQALWKLAERAIDEEFYRILGKQAPQMAVDKVLERLKEDSSLMQGYFSVDDITLAVQGVLNDLLEAWVEVDGQPGCARVAM